MTGKKYFWVLLLNVRLVFIASLAMVQQKAVAQIVSPTASLTQPTQYTNGMQDDEIFVFCSPDVNGNTLTGSLSATPTIAGPGFSFDWGLYDDVSHTYVSFSTQSGVPSSTVNGLASGGYSVTITNNAGQSETFITWLYVSELLVDISTTLDPVNPGCEPFDVNGTISATGFTYWDPVDPGTAPFIVDANTDVTVCFSATHTYVSDVGFVLIGPPGCGSPAFALYPHPEVVNAGNGCCCNSGNNINNLCFSTNNANQLNMCSAGTPLGGSYAIYNGSVAGSAYPTGGLSNIYGCNAAEGGWAVQIYDCIGADVGALTAATITFDNGPSQLVYSSGAINSTINDNSCDPATASIYVVPLTTPINPNPQQVPNSGTLTYQLGINGVPVSLAPGTNSFSQTVNPIPTYDEWYYLEIQDQLGCQAIDSVMFDFTGYADATIDPINATNQLCTASPAVQLTSVGVGGTYTGTGVSATGLFDPLAAGIGLHTITHTIPDPCGDVKTIDITVSDLTLSTSATASVCTADNGTATVNALSGTAPFTYAWATVPPQTTQTAIDLAPGSYDVEVVDDEGCSLIVSAVVAFDPSDLTVSIPTFTDALCNVSCDGTADAVEAGGTAPYLFAWDDGSNQLTANAIDLCAGVYNVGVMDVNGCLATDQVIIGEPTPVTSVAVMNVQSDCGQPNGEVEVTGSGGMVAADYSYSWNTVPVQSTSIATGLVPGTYTATVTDDNGCSIDVDVDVTSTPGFSVSILTSSDAICFGSCTGTATAHPDLMAVAPLTFLWNTVPPQNNAIANALCAGDYDVTVTDDLGCVATTTVTIGEPTQLTVAASVDLSLICIGGTAQLSAAANGGTTPIAGYQWNAVPADASLVASDQNPTVMPVSTNTTYSVVATDANGCISAVSNTTVALRAPLTLDVIRPLAGPDTSICYGDLATLNLVATGGDGNYTFVQSPNPTPLALPLTVQPLVTTVYDFAVIDGCTTPPATATSTITVNPLPIVQFSVDDPFGCDEHTAVFTDMSIPAAQQWLWDFGDANSGANSATQSIANHTFSGPGMYDISLQVITAAGCIGDTVFPQFVEVYPLPQANFSVDPTITNLLDATFHFTDLSTGTVNSWDWTFGDGGQGNVMNPVHNYTDTGIFVITLIVTTDENCTDFVRQSVEVEPDFMFYIPNSFTPNEDGKNDFFRPYGEGVHWETLAMTIYNRWGEQIFFTASIDNPWDGSYQGAQVESGDYVYTITIVDANYESHTYYGNVNLVR